MFEKGVINLNRSTFLPPSKILRYIRFHRDHPLLPSRRGARRRGESGRPRGEKLPRRGWWEKGRRWMDLFFIAELDRVETPLMNQWWRNAEAFSRAINAALNRAKENAPAKRAAIPI